MGGLCNEKGVGSFTSSCANRQYNLPAAPARALAGAAGWYSGMADGHLADVVNELPLLIHADARPFDRFALGHAGQKFPRNLGQQGSRDDVIDVTCPALYFLATAGDGGHHCVVVGEGALVMLPDPI